MQTLCFEPIIPADFAALYAIERKAYPIPWQEKVMRNMVDGHDEKIKILRNQQILGYAFVMTVLDEATLLNITIDPDEQGHGYGRQLLQYLKAILKDKGIYSLFLEVRMSNAPARRLYESEGFHEIDVRKNYYPTAKGREDAIIMACSL